MDFIFYTSLAAFIFLFGAIDKCIDYDFWARLVVGKSYFQTGTLFHNDFQSYGTTGEFIDHEWGSSLIFYLIQNNFGDFGLYLFKSIIIFLTVFLITKTIRLENKKIRLYFLFFFFTLQGITYNIFSTIRCQTFSFFFFALYLYILRKVQKEKNYRILWCLPLLNIVWANLHGGFAIGLITVLIFAIGEFLNKRDWKPYLWTFSVSAVTTLINPYGIKYIYFIFNALALDRVHVLEWQSSFWGINKYMLLKYKLFFFPVIGLFIYSIFKEINLKGTEKFYKSIDKTKYLLLIFMLIISIKSLRFHVFFTYSVIALCYCDFYKIFSLKLPKIIDNTKEIILCVLIFISLISHLYDYKFINTVKNGIYPVYCIEFLKLNNIKGNLLLNFHLGSYASYKLYPNNLIYMDGRYEEVYDTGLINDMADIFRCINYKNILKKSNHEIIIIEKYYPLYNALKNDKDWFLAYEDSAFGLFLLNKYKNKQFKMPTKDMKYYNSTKFDTDIDWLK